MIKSLYLVGGTLLSRWIIIPQLSLDQSDRSYMPITLSVFRFFKLFINISYITSFQDILLKILMSQRYPHSFLQTIEYEDILTSPNHYSQLHLQTILQQTLNKSFLYHYNMLYGICCSSFHFFTFYLRWVFPYPC